MSSLTGECPVCGGLYSRLIQTDLYDDAVCSHCLSWFHAILLKSC